MNKKVIIAIVAIVIIAGGIWAYKKYSKPTQPKA